MESTENKSLIDDLNSFPLIKATLFYIPGILIGYYAPIGVLWSLVCLAICTAVSTIAYLKKKTAKDHILEGLYKLSFAGMWISAGMFATCYRSVDRPDIETINSQGIKYGVISSVPEEKTKTYKTTIKLIDNGEPEILTYISKDSLKTPPAYGDLIGFYSGTEYLTGNGNPLEFNYADYMAMQGIYCRTFIKSNEYEILMPAYRKGIKYYGAIGRESLLQRYTQSGISGQELAVLEALTLGYKDDLDDETKYSFQASGAMHILAVSGLHTGIIMLITNILLSFMNRIPVLRILKTVIIISVLWGFAAITGFSSSVCRSALMFTIMQITITRGFSSSAYNSVAGSAFILLIINPLLIFNTGFLLSYLAVMGILSCMPVMEGAYPQIQYWRYSKIKIFMLEKWKMVLGVIMVSAAAQIGTGVLSMKTFGVFPVYFILTNFIVLPLSYLIMISAVALLTLGFWDFGAQGITWILKHLLEWLTHSVSWIESLPGSCISGIMITKSGALLLQAIIVFAILLIHYRSHVFRLAMLATACAFALQCCIVDYQGIIDSQLIIYNHRRSPMYSYVSADSGMTLYQTPDTARYNNPALKTAGLLGVDSIRELNLDSISDLREMYLKAGGKTFCIIRNKSQLKAMKDYQLKANYLIISGNTYIKAEDVKDCFGAEGVIFDSSISKYRVDKCEDQLKNAGLTTHYVCRDGAFIYGDGQKLFDWY